jgi:hypothetical protein
MNQGGAMKTLRVVTIVAVLVFTLCAPSTAAITEPVITATVADTTTMSLLIEGFNLPKGAVYMGQPGGGAKKLNVISSSSTAIEAQLLSTEPGTYIVAIATRADQIWTGHVTVGAVGPQGDQGPQGPAGISGYHINSKLLLTGIGALVTTTTSCNAGEKAVGGGWMETADETFQGFGSYPAADGSGWTIKVKHLGGGSNLTAYAVCVSVAP